MSGSKFYIWSGGRWREVNTASGEVAGWARRPRFVFARRGRLRVAARRRLLAALRAHAADLPSAVELGPRLSILRNEPAPAAAVRAVPSAQPTLCAHHHCCVYSHGLPNNNFGNCNHNGALITNSFTIRNETDDLLASHGASLKGGSPAGAGGAPGVAEPVGAPGVAAVRGPRATVDAAVQHSPADRALTINLDATTSSLHERTAPTRRSDEPRPRALPLRNLLEKRSSLTKRRRSVLSDSDDSERHFKPASEPRRGQGDERSPKRPQKTASKSKSSATSEARKKRRAESESDSGKELTVSEADVRALRGLVARTRSDALARFDADDDYKRLLFYAINPLVHVQRCPLTERKLRERFAARLGLAPVSPSPTPSPARRALRSNREKRSAEEPDSDDELELFQNSRGDRGSAKLNKSKSHKNVREVASLRSSYKDKRLKIGDGGEGGKSRSSPRLGARVEIDRSSRLSATLKKPEILRGTYENEFESNYKSSNQKFGTNIKSKGENDAFDDSKRRSLRRSTLAQSERVAELSHSADEHPPPAPPPPPPPPPRASQRHTSTHNNTTDSSDSDDTHFGSSDGEAERMARRRRVSDEGRDTPVDSGRGSEPADERQASRRRSKPEKRDTVSRRKSGRASISVIPKKYDERSTSEEKPASKSSRSAGGGGGARVAEPPVKRPKPPAEPAPRAVGVGPELTHTISKRASRGKAKEYSNLEDHAIVAWVSSGARARRVNGNALWRELQEQFPRLAGQGRSWHSLRNRYLRYILPALGALHLPPATASRLRAAAAAGSMKRRGAAGEARRNSIFDQSEVSAASARGPRPRPEREPTPTSTPTPTHPALRKRSEGGSSSARRPAARDVTARDVTARDVTARDLTARDVTARDVTAREVTTAREEVTSDDEAAAPGRPGRDDDDAEGEGGEGRGRGERARRVRKLFNPKLVL